MRPHGLVADYADGSGRYRVYVWGSVMLTDFDGEAWTADLVRAPELDAPADWEWADYALDPATGFASNFDGEIGTVRIAGLAYRVSDMTMDADRARAVLASIRDYDDDTDPLAHAGNVLTLPGAPSVVGAMAIEPCEPTESGYAEFLASLVAVCYVRGGWDRL